MLVTKTLSFSADTVARNVWTGTLLGLSLDKPDSPLRVIKALVYNEGDQNVTIDLDGLEGESWTERGTVTVKARSKGTLEGAIRGSETSLRIQALAVESDATKSVVTSGLIEIFDSSDMYKR